MTIISEESAPHKVAPAKSSRFSFMLKEVKEETETKKSFKMRYDLPNVTKLQTPSKAVNRPLMIVELSAKVESPPVSPCGSDNELFE